MRFQCIIETCNCDAYFGYEKQKIPYYCFAHKEHDMIHLKIDEEKFLDCGNLILPLFKIDVISSQKEKKMKKEKKIVKSEKKERRCCIVNGCLKLARYNYNDKCDPMFCIVHKRSDMINLLPCARKKSNWLTLNKSITKILINDENYSTVNYSTVNSALLQEDLKT